MKLRRCDNLHYYDGDIYSSCPHCAEKRSAVPEQVPEPVPESENEQYSQEQNEAPAYVTPSNEEQYMVYSSDTSGTHDAPEESSFQDEPASSESVQYYGQQHTASSDDSSYYDSQDNDPQYGQEAYSPAQEMYSAEEYYPPESACVSQAEQLFAPDNTGTGQGAQYNVPDHGSVSQSVQYAAPESTVPEKPALPEDMVINRFTGDIGSAKRQAAAMSGDSETVIFTDSCKITEDLILGWLVIVNTDQKGKCFAVSDLKSTIGRGDIDRLVDIDIHSDRTVSRGAQAIIVYDRLNRKFFLQNGNGKTVIYLNKKVVLTYEELNPYDRIQLGMTEMVFVPLCTEKFSWE